LLVAGVAALIVALVFLLRGVIANTFLTPDSPDGFHQIWRCSVPDPRGMVGSVAHPRPQSPLHLLRGNPMAHSRKALTVGAIGVAALALIGTGAGASFTDAVHDTQNISAGTMNVQIIDGAGGSVSSDYKSVTFNFGGFGSTFESPLKVVTIKNNGDVPATAKSIQMTESHPGDARNNALLAQTNVCIQSTDASGGPWTEGNGPLATAIALNPTVAQNPVVLQPGQTMTFSFTLYAGQDSANCNETSSDGSNTRAAWDGYNGGPYHTPASLTNAAQGGTISPTMTFNFTG
jgi:hypothetical protein